MLAGYNRRKLPGDIIVFFLAFGLIAGLGAVQCTLSSQAGTILKSGIPFDTFRSLAEKPAIVSNEAARKMQERLKQTYKYGGEPSARTLVSSLKVTLPATNKNNLSKSVQQPLVQRVNSSVAPFSYYTKKIDGCSVHVLVFDPRHRECRLSVQCAKGLPRDSQPFSSLVQAASPRAAVAGTYFSKSSLHPVGDIVVDGKLLCFGGFGTAMTVSPAGEVQFQQVPWGRHMDWSGFQTVIAAGPTLLANGNVVVDPIREGFRDPHVLGSACRCAVGTCADGFVVVACVPTSIRLERLASIMLKLDCRDAMTLDGGGSLSLYVDGTYIIRPSRKLTNILTIGETS